MTLLSQHAKACFQYAKATIPELWSHLYHPYQQDEAIELAQANLRGRLTHNSGRLNFMMVVPVVNWEIALLDHAAAHGSCHHLSFESRAFFDSALEWKQYRASNAEKLKRFFHDSYRPDDINILFLYISEFHIDPEYLREFKQRNVIVIHFNWDDRLHYTSRHKGQSVGVRNVAKTVDFNLSMAVGPLSRYATDGAAVFYWRGKSDTTSRELALPKVEFNRVLFFGSRYGYRAELIDHLTRKGLPIDIYGSGWGTEFISYESLIYKIPRYALNLGVSTIGYTQSLSCVKGRDIEVPLSGGLYLTNQSREIEEVYVPGKEILTYKSKDDCYRIACEVLNNPLIFSDIRRMGAMKAQSFSWEARFEYLVELIQSLSYSEIRS